MKALMPQMIIMLETKQWEWNRSYGQKDNFIFCPHEEVVRFFSKYIYKRKGLDVFEKKHSLESKPKILDLGCGIGRHVIFGRQMQTDAVGIDLSEKAIRFARMFAAFCGIPEADEIFFEGNCARMPFKDGEFDFIVSHGVLDSMPLALAKQVIEDAYRVIKPAGLFYCDLISGDDSEHHKEFSGEQVIETLHERGTIQLYYNFALIRELIDGLFTLREGRLIRRENLTQSGYASRYHLVLEKK